MAAVGASLSRVVARLAPPPRLACPVMLHLCRMRPAHGLASLPVCQPPRPLSAPADARTANAERVLSGTWAGQDPEKVLQDERFYIDVMRYAHQVGVASLPCGRSFQPCASMVHVITRASGAPVASSVCLILVSQRTSVCLLGSALPAQGHLVCQPELGQAYRAWPQASARPSMLPCHHVMRPCHVSAPTASALHFALRPCQCADGADPHGADQPAAAAGGHAAALCRWVQQQAAATPLFVCHLAAEQGRALGSEPSPALPLTLYTLPPPPNLCHASQTSLRAA